jgi:hypothetical protein
MYLSDCAPLEKMNGFPPKRNEIVNGNNKNTVYGVCE